MDQSLDNISDILRRFVDKVGKLSTFFIIPLVLITMWDVFCRKVLWLQIWLVENFGRIFESTLLQELEWRLAMLPSADQQEPSSGAPLADAGWVLHEEVPQFQ